MYRLYREEHLAVRRLRRKRLVRPAADAVLLSAVNQEWAMDFVADGLASGRGLRMLTVVDNFSRECLAIEVDGSLSSRRVTRVLEWIVTQRGTPASIRCDNGPEFTSPHIFSAGANNEALPCVTSSPENRCRTATSKASTAGFAMSA